MNPEQRDLALALLRAGSSEAGHGKLLDIMSLQRDLNNDPELYYVTIFGAPGGPEPWGWRFEGHHISRNVAVVGDRVTMTPFFRSIICGNTARHDQSVGNSERRISASICFSS